MLCEQLGRKLCFKLETQQRWLEAPREDFVFLSFNSHPAMLFVVSA